MIFFSVSHQYGDETIEYNAALTITDDDTGSSQLSQFIDPFNVQPPTDILQNVQVDDENRASIAETESVVITGEVTKPGTLSVDWDGAGPEAAESFVISSAGNFAVSHTYPDDDPTLSSFDLYNVQVDSKRLHLVLPPACSRPSAELGYETIFTSLSRDWIRE